MKILFSEYWIPPVISRSSGMTLLEFCMIVAIWPNFYVISISFLGELVNGTYV